ncbi:hypothetical protein, partial [Umezakia ovalisporum]|uniref:hypothetical protein n=1 Tax=Umezakia ovalisporum TaxID=75695 RepID=UPI0039C5BDFC
MKKFLFLLIILIGLSQQGFAQFNLKHGRVYRELMSTIPSWISPRTAVEDNDSISLRQLGPDSFHANYSNMRLTPNYGNNVVLIKLKVDSIDGDIWFMQLDSRSNLIGWRRLYHYPTHNHWFRIWTPEDTSFFYARVINRSSISQGTRVYQTQDVVIRLYPDTINQGYPEILSKWVKGIGAIGPKGGSFFHMTYFGLLGGYDSIATYPLCVKNPLNPNDFLYVNPMFNTCFIRVSGLDK